MKRNYHTNNNNYNTHHNISDYKIEHVADEWFIWSTLIKYNVKTRVYIASQLIVLKNSKTSLNVNVDDVYVTEVMWHRYCHSKSRDLVTCLHHETRPHRIA